MRDLQSVDECECRDIFPAVRNFGELILEVVDVRLEVVALSHFEDDEVVVILLIFLTGGVLTEETSVISSKLWTERDGKE